MHDDYPDIGWLLPRHIDWLTGSGVPMAAIIRPEPVRLAHGFQASHDGRFEHDSNGPDWFVFTEAKDLIFWRPRTGEFATLDGRAFALGEAAISNAATYSFGHFLNIFSDPLTWLIHGRDGIVIIDWSRAFDSLRACPRIAVVEAVLPLYQQHMRPARMPELFVLRGRKEAAE